MKNLKIPKGYKLKFVEFQKRFRGHLIEVNSGFSGWDLVVTDRADWRGLAFGLDTIEMADALGRDLINAHIAIEKAGKRARALPQPRPPEPS